MGLFSKDSKKEDKKKGASDNSNQNSDEPPGLPKLPELPDMESSSASSGKSQKEKTSEPLPKLPSYPNSSAGDKFSQNSIKQAVSGEKEGGKADEFESEVAPRPQEGEQGQRMQESPAQGNYEMEKHTRRAEHPEAREIGEKPQPPPQKPSNEPVFIRIDKFEDSLNSFEKIKDEISEVEKLLKDAKHTKQKEDKELKDWENKMQEMKDKLSKIDSDIFSKV